MTDTVFTPIAEPDVPRWSICDEEWLYIGDEVAILSEDTMQHADAYGRIVGTDAATGLPVVLLLGGRSTQQHTLPLGDILGRRVRKDADQ